MPTAELRSTDAVYPPGEAQNQWMMSEGVCERLSKLSWGIPGAYLTGSFIRPGFILVRLTPARAQSLYETGSDFTKTSMWWLVAFTEINCKDAHTMQHAEHVLHGFASRRLSLWPQHRRPP